MKCRPIFWEIGAQCGPTAAGRRSVLYPQFRRMRFALSITVVLKDYWDKKNLQDMWPLSVNSLHIRGLLFEKRTQANEFNEDIAGFNLPITMWMRWIWLGHIGKCKPHSSKLGVQYGPPAYSCWSILHPQFLRIRYAFIDAPSPDSWHSPNTASVLHAMHDVRFRTWLY